jgi:hypothetical protein
MPYSGLLARRFAPWMLMIVLFSSLPQLVMAGVSSATVTITVTDTSGALIRDAEVVLRNVETNQEQHSTSSNAGGATFPFLSPGLYSLVVSKSGFSDVAVNNVRLNVGDQRQLNLVLRVGATQQTVDVDGSGLTINTTDGSVSTVVDRQFVASIPLNGRSFQDLISMTPGVVTASPQTSGSSPGESGDFSINGQRTESNYYMVDGVAANVSPSSTAGSGVGAAGVVAAGTALGTTQGLLSVDDLQEFRVESSSYSAEYGRSPGGQLTFVTRSGTNAFHGSAYEYFRNGWFDANNWFNDYLGEPKLELHQNDFGGTLGGPVWIPRVYKGTDKTFFFGSYEGLRLIDPAAASVEYVPDTYMREQAPAAMQPLLNAFPKPNGKDYGTASAPSLAVFSQGYSVPAGINSSSVRIDHTFTPSLSAFFRFAGTPSSLNSRSLSVLSSGQMNVQTYTLGTTWLLSKSVTNQFRLGYTRSSASTSSVMDSFGGAVPVDLGRALGSTTGVTGQNVRAETTFEAAGVGLTQMNIPASIANQHQWNIVDSLDITHGSQQWKFGIDFRQIDNEATRANVIYGLFSTPQSALSNVANTAEYIKYLTAKPVFNQFAAFAQDDWRLNRRLSLSAGLRWEVLPPPHNAISPQPYTLTGNLSEPSTVTLAPSGTPLWHTSWYSLAPRLGVAWQTNTSRNWETVVRAGGGVFFDTVAGAVASFNTFGYSAQGVYSNVPVPLTASQQNIAITTAPPYTNLYIYPSHLQSPYTLQWNTSIDQGLGSNSILTISYIGSAGRRLSAVQELSLASLNSSLGRIFYLASHVTSDYDALQTRFQRSVTKGLTALASYTWSHSIDYGSNASALTLTRGNSDFDVRNSFQGGITWDIPHLATSSRLASTVANGWGIDGRLIMRTAYPITLLGNLLIDPTDGSEYYTNVNLVPGEPIYLYGGKYPGGKSLNRAAFVYPSGTDAGNAPRNFARGFGQAQVNFAARRDFALSERVHLQFRAEAFNIFNHPIFGYVDPSLTDATFGQATMTLNSSLGTVASQYQQGGPRSMQFTLRLVF